MRFRCVLWLLLFPALLHCQKLLPVRSGDKMGYINADGKLVLPLKYDAAGPFSPDGIAVVGIGKKYILISDKGEELIRDPFDFIEHIDGNYFAVQRDTAWGIFHTEKGMVFPILADHPPLPGLGAFMYQVNGYWGLVTADNKEILPPLYDTIIPLTGEYWEYGQGKKKGVVSKNASVIVEGFYKGISVVRLASNNVLCCQSDSVSDFYFIIPGKMAPEPAIKWQKPEGGRFLFFTYAKGSGFYSDSISSYYYDSTIQRMDFFSPSLILTERKGLYGIMDLNGKTLLDANNQDLLPAGNSFIWRQDGSGKWGALDLAGKTLLDPQFDEIKEFRHNLAAVRKGKNWGLVNIYGEMVVTPGYKEVDIEKGKVRLYGFNAVTEIAKTDKWGNLLDKTTFGNLRTLKIGASGNPTGGDITWLNNRSGNNSNDSAAYKYGWFFDSKSRKWGMKDTTGKVLIPPVFHAIQLFEDLGLTRVLIRIPAKEFSICGREVERSKKFGLIDHVRRRVVLPTQYLNIFIEDFYKAPDAVARVMDTEGYFHYVTRMGKKTGSGAVFIDDFRCGLARVNKGGWVKIKCDTCLESYSGAWTMKMPDTSGFRTMTYSQGGFYVIGGKWGWINERGEEVIPAQFQFAWEFVLGASVFKLKNKWGVIDTLGKLIVKPEYDQVERIARPKKSSAADSILFRLKKNLNKCAFVNWKGGFVTDLKYQQCRDFKDGYAAVQFKNKWGFIDTSGKEVTPLHYDRVEDFVNGYAAVKKKGKWGFVEAGGKVAVEMRYMDVGQFSDDYAWFMNNGKYGFVDEAGNEIIPAAYQNAGNFYNGLAPVQKENRWGYIDKTGKPVIPFKYSSASPFNEYDMAIVKNDNGYGMIRPDGKELLPLKYQDIGNISDGMIRIKTDNKFGYADNLGNIVIPLKYGMAQDFSEGLAAVSDGGGWYYITVTGQRISEMTFMSAKPFTNGFGIASNAGRYSLVDPFGNVNLLATGWTPQSFSEDGFSVVTVRKKGQAWLGKNGRLGVKKYYQGIKTFYDGNAPACRNRKWGILDKAGYCITGFKYDDVGKFSNGLLRVKIYSFYGMADGTGKIIVPVEFEVLGPPYEGAPFFYAERKATIGYLKKDGSWLWEPK